MDTRKVKDVLARRTMFCLCLFVLGLVFFMAGGLYYRSRPILAIKPVAALLFSSTWHPTQGQFGLSGFIAGTLWVTIIAMLIATPISILAAIFLSEYASKKIREFIKQIIDLLAGISPVIYGVWGIIAIVPLIRDYLMPFFSEKLPFWPFTSDNYTGFSALTGGIVLAVMACPIIISVV